MRPKKINLLEWFAIIPKIASLVDEIADALRDKKLTKTEIDKIGADFIAIVGAVL